MLVSFDIWWILTIGDVLSMRDVFVLVWEREFNGNDARFQKQKPDATESDNPLHFIL